MKKYTGIILIALIITSLCGCMKKVETVDIMYTVYGTVGFWSHTDTDVSIELSTVENPFEAYQDEFATEYNIDYDYEDENIDYDTDIDESQEEVRFYATGQVVTFDIAKSECDNFNKIVSNMLEYVDNNKIVKITVRNDLVENVEITEYASVYPGLVSDNISEIGNGEELYLDFGNGVQVVSVTKAGDGSIELRFGNDYKYSSVVVNNSDKTSTTRCYAVFNNSPEDAVSVLITADGKCGAKYITFTGKNEITCYDISGQIVTNSYGELGAYYFTDELDMYTYDQYDITEYTDCEVKEGKVCDCQNKEHSYPALGYVGYYVNLSLMEDNTLGDGKLNIYDYTETVADTENWGYRLKRDTAALDDEGNETGEILERGMDTLPYEIDVNTGLLCIEYGDQEMCYVEMVDDLFVESFLFPGKYFN